MKNPLPMILRNILLLLCTAAIGSQLTAQNDLPVLKPGDSIPGVLRVTKRDGYYNKYDYFVAMPSKSLVTLNPLKTDYKKAGTAALNSFQTQHIGKYGFMDIGRSFLDLTNRGFDAAVQPAEDEKSEEVKESMKKVLFGNKMLRELIYSWMMPYYQKAFSIMSVPEQEDYIKVFVNAKAYADTFNLARETAVVNDPETYNYASAVGSLPAFIYRRVANKELTLEECKEWLNRIISDLSAFKRKNPSPMDYYVIEEKVGIGQDYYYARRYGYYGHSTSGPVVVHKENGKYVMVPGGNFEYVSERGDRILMGRSSDTTRGRPFGYLYIDSASATYVPMQPPSHQTVKVAFKGEGRAGRMMLFDYPLYERTDEYGEEYSLVGELCTLVDIDSGTILIDSMIIPLTTEQAKDVSNYDVAPAVYQDYVIFMDASTKKYGVIDKNGYIILPAIYSSIEKTEDPEVVKVNGKKKVSVHGGGKPPKKPKK